MLNFVLWILGITVVSGIGVAGWFFAYAHAKHLREDGVDHGTLITVAMVIYLAAGVVMDVLWNLTYGSVAFREWPREWLFTARVQRHVTSQYSRQRKLALKWAKRLNDIDPGHVKI